VSQLQRFVSSTAICAVVIGSAAIAQAKPKVPPPPSGPTIVDLTAAGSTGTANGAMFRQGQVQPTGSGVIDSFVRIDGHHKDGIEQGYNTDYRPLQFDEKKDATFTHSLDLSDVPLVTIDGMEYREFMLDLNDPLGGNKDTLFLDQLQIFLGDSGSLHDFPSYDGHANMVYNLDGAGDTSIKLSAATNKGGSGKGDMFADIPADVFDHTSFSNVYLYSQFSSAGGGFEEWAVHKQVNAPTVDPVVPLPPAAWSGLAGIIGLAAVSVVRSRKVLA
jgi:hypothetical protein